MASPISSRLDIVHAPRALGEELLRQPGPPGQARRNPLNAGYLLMRAIFSTTRELLTAPVTSRLNDLWSALVGASFVDKLTQPRHVGCPAGSARIVHPFVDVLLRPAQVRLTEGGHRIQYVVVGVGGGEIAR